MRARIVIVGGGVIGISIALHAARRTDPLREPVMLLERDGVGTSPSSCASAVLGQFFGSSHASGMARDSLRYYQGLEGRTGRSMGFLQTGVLTLAKRHDAHHLRRMRELVEMQDSIGIQVECVGAERIRELFPGIEIPDDALAAWEPTAACLDPHLALESLSTLARNRGAVIRPGNRVESLLIEGGSIVGVVANGGRIDCDQAVLSAGPWTNQLLAFAGVELPLEGVLAEHFYLAGDEDSIEEMCAENAMSLASPEGSGATGWFSREAMHAGSTEDDFEDRFGVDGSQLRTAHPVLTDPSTGFFVRCDPLHGRISVGRRGGEFKLVEVPDNFDASVNPEFKRWAREALEARLPHYSNVADVGAECGMFTRTPNNMPVIGPIPAVKGLYVAAGFSGHSFTMAPSVGEGMAQMLMGEPSSAFDPEYYSPSRYL